MRWIASISFALVVVLAVLSFLPLVPADAWWIRYWDFPRVQIAFLLVVLLAIHLIASERFGPSLAAVLLGLAALGYHAYKLFPYAPPVPNMARSVETCAEGADLRILTANVQLGNESGPAFLDLVDAVEPDLILVLETDAYWDEVLGSLGAEYPHAVQHVPEDARFYGMHLLSRLPLVSPEVVMSFETETPSILTGVELPSGEAVRFHGLHPRPPHWFSQGTTLRDATLYRAALDAAESGQPTIIAGDLNAVPWERVTLRAMRLGQLLEPRIGRGLVPTYGAESLWMSWPLDYVLHQDSFGLLAYRRLPNLGSDHHPVLAHLCHAPELAEAQFVPLPDEEDFEAAAEAFAEAERIRAED